jgi:predicted nucleic acid-binding protein
MSRDTVFLDTVGLLALWDQSDQWHTAASEAFSQLSTVRCPVVTTTFVLLECGNAAARRPYRLTVDRLRENLEAANGLIVPTEADWRQAWAAYRRGEADQAGIVDHVSFLVMRRLGLTTAFTNDHHFRAAGFIVLF